MLKSFVTSLIACSWLVGATGCTSVPVEYEPIHVFSDIDRIESHADDFRPGKVPPRPDLISIVVDGVEYNALDAKGTEELIAYVTALKGNSDRLEEAYEGIKALETEIRATGAMGRAVEERLNWYGKEFYVLQHRLREEQKDHALDNLINRAIQFGLIGLGILAF